jgi:hypothetical protein
MPGLANRYEDERLTEDERDVLPERINELRPARFGDWLSEREWIPVMMETTDQPRRLILKLDVNETNIDRLESASCEEILAGREREYQESYHAIPPLDELRARYGNPDNRRIYMMSRDIEGRWGRFAPAGDRCKQADRLRKRVGGPRWINSRKL